MLFLSEANLIDDDSLVLVTQFWDGRFDKGGENPPQGC